MKHFLGNSKIPAVDLLLLPQKSHIFLVTYCKWTLLYCRKMYTGQFYLILKKCFCQPKFETQLTSDAVSCISGTCGGTEGQQHCSRHDRHSQKSLMLALIPKFPLPFQHSTPWDLYFFNIFYGRTNIVSNILPLVQLSQKHEAFWKVKNFLNSSSRWILLTSGLDIIFFGCQNLRLSRKMPKNEILPILAYNLIYKWRN